MNDLNEKLRQYQRNYYNLQKDKKWNVSFLNGIKMNKKTLKFDNVKINRKEFHVSKQSIALNLVNVN